LPVEAGITINHTSKIWRSYTFTQPFHGVLIDSFSLKKCLITGVALDFYPTIYTMIIAMNYPMNYYT
ncbi:hypothetical protein B8W51_05180, partial [Cronobacter sakazakii]